MDRQLLELRLERTISYGNVGTEGPALDPQYFSAKKEHEDGHHHVIQNRQVSSRTPEGPHYKSLEKKVTNACREKVFLITDTLMGSEITINSKCEIVKLIY